MWIYKIYYSIVSTLAVIYYTSKYFIWWDFGGMTIEDPKMGGINPNCRHPKPRPSTARDFFHPTRIPPAMFWACCHFVFHSIDKSESVDYMATDCFDVSLVLNFIPPKSHQEYKTDKKVILSEEIGQLDLIILCEFCIKINFSTK